MRDQPLTIAEVAEFLRLHVSTVRRAVRDGAIPSIRLLGMHRIRRSVVEEILRGGTNPNSAQISAAAKESKRFAHREKFLTSLQK